ncbi:CobW family GTP-binding protein [Marinobacter sp. F3R11]|uniref:CobW family GTP-binding protein n=1 Tax=Marinobacter sp. F3R11 TaxID=2267231 RepID=UPI000DEA9877|nr:GTP-binding protein [Marinobacter sp. F3R11]RBW48564.1 GTP-binding protein [Marinobacter sp. F3R11]
MLRENVSLMPVSKAIPTNIITGFLGVGKTTALLHLLKHKPEAERWAVLVNEFGEVGIDGSIFAGHESGQQGVFIREVPGGCMCCAAGLPMQVALNMLIASARPDRLLIEPTGLGHPKEVLEVLGSEHYREILDLRATITLVDARKIHDHRYVNHTTFNQQLSVADIIVANKAEQYQSADFPALLDYLDRALNAGNKSVFQVSWGELEPGWLDASPGDHNLSGPRNDSGRPLSFVRKIDVPAQGYLDVGNKNEGFYSQGWVFSADWVFDAHRLSALLTGADAERIKGVFRTDQGVIAYDKADNVLSETELENSLDSRLECISADKHALEYLEEAVIDCVLPG